MVMEMDFRITVRELLAAVGSVNVKTIGRSGQDITN
jgi:hypothetical protein